MLYKKKIALTFPFLHSYGGGEIFCEAVANFLIKYFAIDLYIYDNKKKINKEIKFKKDVNIIRIKSKNIFIDFLCCKSMIFSQYYLIYFFKNLNLINYHFVFSLAGEMTSKLRTYQYLHHPFYSLNPNHYLAVGLKWKKFHKIFIRFIFTIFIRFLLNIKKNIFEKVITFTNSSWSKKRIKNIYKINKIKIICPTFDMPKYFDSNNNFEKRNDDFVILGRISDDKNIVEGIEFFQKIKDRFKNSKMHLIGPIDNKYKKKLNNLLLDKDIILHGYLDKKNRNSILKNSKFGLHFFKYEHFGRSVLEMQKLGMIVFVHKSGGVENIVFSNVQKYRNLKDLEINFCKVKNNVKLRNCILKLNKNKLSNQYTSNSFYKSLENNLLH